MRGGAGCGGGGGVVLRAPGGGGGGGGGTCPRSGICCLRVFGALDYQRGPGLWRKNGPLTPPPPPPFPPRQLQ
jgi:hypothetical protein